MMRCPKCGTENRDSAKFCDECGYEMPVASSRVHEAFSQEAPAAFSAAAVPSAPQDPYSSSEGRDHMEDSVEDDFAALFNDSGTVKLTHIAEKLRRPEESGSVVFVPDDDESDEQIGGSSDINAADDDFVFDLDREDPFREDRLDAAKGIPFADDIGDEEGDGSIQPIDEGDADLAADELPDKDGIAGFGQDDIFSEDIYSVDTAPLSTADVHHAIEEDDQSTMLANAAAMAHVQRMQAQRSQTSVLDMPQMPAVNSAPKDAHSFLAFSSGRNRRFSKRFKTGFVIALCVIAALIAVLGITYALQIWGGKTIPDVMGASSSDAKYLLEESGFFVEEKQVVSDDVEGIVIEVWPEPGSRQPLGSTVTIGVSTFRVIPDIVGLQLDEAQDLLSEYGYTDIELVMKKSDEDEGDILGVTPSVGTRANAETHITVEVAQSYLVPDVVGDMRDDAISVLESEGFTAEIQYDYSNTDPEGSVMRTVPAAGEPCKTTTPVQVVIAVSRATELGNLTSELFAGVDTLTYNGNMYQYVKGSFATVGCPDNNTLDFTIRARLLDMHTWPDGRTDTWVGNEVTISSTAGWSDNNEFLYMDPNLLS